MSCPSVWIEIYASIVMTCSKTPGWPIARLWIPCTTPIPGLTQQLIASSRRRAWASDGPLPLDVEPEHTVACRGSWV